MSLSSLTVTVATISTLTGYMASMSTSYWNSLQVKGTITSARVTAVLNATCLENFALDASLLKGTLTQPSLPANAIYTGSFFGDGSGLVGLVAQGTGLDASSLTGTINSVQLPGTINTSALNVTSAVISTLTGSTGSLNVLSSVNLSASTLTCNVGSVNTLQVSSLTSNTLSSFNASISSLNCNTINNLGVFVGSIASMTELSTTNLVVGSALSVPSINTSSISATTSSFSQGSCSVLTFGTATGKSVVSPAGSFTTIAVSSITSMLSGLSGNAANFTNMTCNQLITASLTANSVGSLFNVNSVNLNSTSITCSIFNAATGSLNNLNVGTSLTTRNFSANVGTVNSISVSSLSNVSLLTGITASLSSVATTTLTAQVANIDTINNVSNITTSSFTASSLLLANIGSVNTLSAQNLSVMTLQVNGPFLSSGAILNGNVNCQNLIISQPIFAYWVCASNFNFQAGVAPFAGPWGLQPSSRIPPGVSLLSGNNIIFPVNGIYNISWSARFSNASVENAIWFRSVAGTYGSSNDVNRLCTTSSTSNNLSVSYTGFFALGDVVAPVVFSQNNNALLNNFGGVFMTLTLLYRV